MLLYRSLTAMRTCLIESYTHVEVLQYGFAGFGLLAGRKTNSFIRTDPLTLGIWSSMSYLSKTIV